MRQAQSSKLVGGHAYFAVGNINIIAILLVLGAAFGLAEIAGENAGLAGRVAIAAVFCFTGLGHFAKSGEMLEMLPPWLPQRKLVVVASGVLELAFAIGLLLPRSAYLAAAAAMAFLLLATPLNVYSACHKVDFGGHAAGPRYLLVRLPLQAVLMAWIWWFALRHR